MDAEHLRLPSRYEVDSEALNAIYEGACAELAPRYRMDDDRRSKLVTLVLRAYFFDIEEDRVPADIDQLVVAAAADFDALMASEH